MKSQVFCNAVERVHRNWLSKTLHMPIIDRNGIDLHDDNFAIEMKSRYLKNFKNTVAIHHYQYEKFASEHKGKDLYWAILFYSLAIEPKHIETDIESHVTSREVWFLHWDFIRYFPVNRRKTADYVNIGRRDFNYDDFSLIKVNNSPLYVPKNSDLEKRVEIFSMVA